MSHDTPPEGMSVARLRELLDAYGAESSRWPAAERAAAEALCARDDAARRLRDEALALDGWLGVVPTHDASAGLHARVAEIPIRHARDATRVGAWPWRVVLGGAFAGALVMLAGVYLGAAGADEDATGVATAGVVASDATTTVDTDTDDGWDDLTTVAFADHYGEEL